MSKKLNISKEFLEFTNQDTSLATFSFEEELNELKEFSTTFKICDGFGNHCVLKRRTFEESQLGFWVNAIDESTKPFIFTIPFKFILGEFKESGSIFGPPVTFDNKLTSSTAEVN